MGGNGGKVPEESRGGGSWRARRRCFLERFYPTGLRIPRVPLGMSLELVGDKEQKLNRNSQSELHDFLGHSSPPSQPWPPQHGFANKWACSGFLFLRAQATTWFPACSGNELHTRPHLSRWESSGLLFPTWQKGWKESTPGPFPLTAGEADSPAGPGSACLKGHALPPPPEASARDGPHPLRGGSAPRAASVGNATEGFWRTRGT